MTYQDCITISQGYPIGTVFMLQCGSLSGIGAKSIPAYPIEGMVESRRMAIGDGKSIHVEIFGDREEFHIDRDPVLSPIKHLLLDVIPYIWRGAPMRLDLRT